MAEKTTTAPERAGFDDPVKTRERDYLNRWPFAREIYETVNAGPMDWSVRVGICGGCGVGKTSVLEFIGCMAEEDGHLVVRFNPWQHSSRDDLWRDFVQVVYRQLESRLGAGRRAQGKVWAEVTRRVLEMAAAICNEKEGEAVDKGLGTGLLRKYFAFAREDAKALLRDLGEKRVILLIDDLDRTAPTLAAELLLAMKELMDIPGFSFVCTFDPAVITQALGRLHPGFSDGLRLMEKIIDFQRWVPPASADGLVRLAVAESRHFAPSLPEPALREVLPLLPRNPRSIRQFVRLLAPLQPQMERHYEHELRWPLILTANVLKVRCPQLAGTLLASRDFWGKLLENPLPVASGDDQGAARRGILIKHVEAAMEIHGVRLETQQQHEVLGLLEKLCSVERGLLWLDGDGLAYQLQAAEYPRVVTGKEFDNFMLGWSRAPKPDTMMGWIEAQATMVARLPVEVYRGAFQAALRRYAQALHELDHALNAPASEPLLASAEALLSLLNTLVQKPGKLGLGPSALDAGEIRSVLGTFSALISGTGPARSKFRPGNAAFLYSFVQAWEGDVTTVIRVLRPWDHQAPLGFHQPACRPIYEWLRKTALSKLGNQVVQDFRNPGFGARLFDERNEACSICRMIISRASPIWSEHRAEMLRILREAAATPAIQENAHELLRLLSHTFQTDHGARDAQEAKALLADKELRDAIWEAATVRRLSPLATGRLEGLSEVLKISGHVVPHPGWWEENIRLYHAALGAPKPTPPGVAEEVGPKE
jgi:hypothetical protein